MCKSEGNKTDLSLEEKEKVSVDPKVEKTDKIDNNLNTGIFSALSPNIPKNPMYSMPNDVSSEVIINEANEEIKKIITEIAASFINAENDHLKSQKNSSIAIWIFVGIQLISFNGLIIYLTYKSINNFSIAVLQELLSFLKYYTGAVILELLSLLAIVFKSTFSQNTKKMVENIINDVTQHHKQP